MAVRQTLCQYRTHTHSYVFTHNTFQSFTHDCARQVIVLRKRDFLDLDNPLLAWMLDYDAVSAVLKSLPAFKGLTQESMEHVLDR